MRNPPEIGDGLEALNRAINAKEIARLVGELARWVDPETFELLPIWFPETARKQPLYKAGWLELATNNNQPKFESNGKANTTLARVLGTSTKARPHWTCCHIWGNDDSSFGSGFNEVNDPRYYSCPANMILLPTPLKAFTDSVPQMKSALRLAAFHLYDFLPEGRTPPVSEDAEEWLPLGWGRGEVSGIRPMNDSIRRSVKDRFEKIMRDFAETSGEYPREQVGRVINYWATKVPASLFGKENQ